MTREPIPDDVTRFILVSITSVPYLEAILLLRNEPQSAWDARRVAQRLYMSEKSAQALLSELHAAGILAMESDEPPSYRYSYRYQPESDDLRRMIDRLAETYSKNLVDVTNLIHSKTNKKAQQFADAFIWRKDS